MPLTRYDSFDWKETLKSNLGNFIEYFFSMLIVVMGLSIITSIPDEDIILKIFGLLSLIYIWFKGLRLRRFAVVYRNDDGFIRHD